MLTMTLALLTQAATLDADPAGAAMTCAAATGAAATERDSTIVLTAHLTHFVMQAAKANPGTQSFLDRTNALIDQVGKPNMPTAEQARALLPLCDQRFPLARRANTVQLPADLFERDTLCLGTLGILMGAAQQLEEDGDATEAKRLKASYDTYTARLTDARIVAAGIKTDVQFAQRMGDALKASLTIGNPDQIERACTAALVKS